VEDQLMLQHFGFLWNFTRFFTIKCPFWRISDTVSSEKSSTFRDLAFWVSSMDQRTLYRSQMGPKSQICVKGKDPTVPLGCCEARQEANCWTAYASVVVNWAKLRRKFGWNSGNQRETQEWIAETLEKPLSIERNDMEYWKYAASETVFWNARRQPCVARRARSKKFFSMRAS